MVVDAIIITRLVHAETGAETFHIAVNSNISTIVQIGLINSALAVIESGAWQKDEG